MRAQEHSPKVLLAAAGGGENLPWMSKPEQTQPNLGAGGFERNHNSQPPPEARAGRGGLAFLSALRRDDATPSKQPHAAAVTGSSGGGDGGFDFMRVFGGAACGGSAAVPPPLPAVAGGSCRILSLSGAHTYLPPHQHTCAAAMAKLYRKGFLTSR
jgi:hypothetical protein